MIDLKNPPPKKESKNSTGLIASPYEGDQYPYQLRITLESEQLKKLGIKTLPGVGTELKFEAKAKVINVRQSASTNQESKSVELQIVAMELDNDADDMARGKGGAIGKVAKAIKGL